MTNPTVAVDVRKQLSIDETFIERQIEKSRKEDFNVSLQDPVGKPLQNAKVSYTLRRLDFQLGTVIWTPFIEDSQANEAIKHFNAVTVPIYWHAMERERGHIDQTTSVKLWQWAHARGLFARAHCIFYPWVTPEYVLVPPWTLKLNKDELEEAMKARLQQILRLFDGKISEYDLSNELLTQDYCSKLLGVKDKSYYFKWAKAIDPDAVFYLNECECIDAATVRKYVTLIRAIIEAGGKVEGLGVQGHFFNGRVPANEILWEMLDALSVFKLPIKITEFGVWRTKDEEQYAQDMLRFYRLCFAHPAVTGIYRWGVWEPQMWIPPGQDYPEPPLWRKDWTTTPAGQAYIKLATEEWVTKGASITDREGRLRFRGLRGTYELESNEHKYTVELKDGACQCLASI